MCYSRPTVHINVSKFASIDLFCRPLAAKIPNFGLYLLMSTVGSNLRKLNTGAQLQIFPYPTASKSFLYSNAFMVKSGAQTLTFKSIMDRQTKNSHRFSPPRRRVKSEPHQTWRGDRGPQAHSCTSTTFRPLSKLNNRHFGLRAMLPVIKKDQLLSVYVMAKLRFLSKHSVGKMGN